MSTLVETTRFHQGTYHNHLTGKSQSVLVVFREWVLRWSSKTLRVVFVIVEVNNSKVLIWSVVRV